MNSETIKAKRFNVLSDFCINRNFLNLEQTDTLLTHLNTLTLTDAKVGNGDTNNEIRQCKLAIVPRNDVFGNLYDDVQEFVTSCNEKFYNFNITGFEPLQYLVYDGPDSHFRTHIDASHYYENGIDRKLSFTIQLSDESEYEGGDLEMWRFGENYQSVIKQKGCIILFSSMVPHRVTPIIKGVRRSLVGWIYGPPFC